MKMHTGVMLLYKYMLLFLEYLSIVAQNHSFSSYPGVLYSGDDFYMLSSGLVLFYLLDIQYYSYIYYKTYYNYIRYIYIDYIYYLTYRDTYLILNVCDISHVRDIYQDMHYPMSRLPKKQQLTIIMQIFGNM